MVKFNPYDCPCKICRAWQAEKEAKKVNRTKKEISDGVNAAIERSTEQYMAAVMESEKKRYAEEKALRNQRMMKLLEQRPAKIRAEVDERVAILNKQAEQRLIDNATVSQKMDEIWRKHIALEAQIADVEKRLSEQEQLNAERDAEIERLREIIAKYAKPSEVCATESQPDGRGEMWGSMTGWYIMNGPHNYVTINGQKYIPEVDSTEISGEYHADGTVTAKRTTWRDRPPLM